MSESWHKYFQEKCPCDNCEQAIKCDLARLACRAFSNFVHTGTFSEQTPRVATHLTFRKIFFEGEN